MRKIKKKTAIFALMATVLVTAAVPAYAQTVKWTFTESNNVYGITTTASGYSDYVTAWAKVLNTNTGTYKYSSNRASKSASATAKKYISNSNYVYRTGGAY